MGPNMLFGPGLESFKDCWIPRKVRIDPISIVWGDFFIISKGQILGNEQTGHLNLYCFVVFKISLLLKNY